MRVKKLVSLLTAFCLSGSVALGVTACKKDNGNGGNGEIPSAVSPAEADAAHYVTNSLHNVNVNYNAPIGE